LRLATDATNEDASLRAPQGSLAVMPPGTIAMPGEPVCWWCGREAPVMLEPAPATAETQRTSPPVLILQQNLAPLQVYRELDDRGRFVKDTVAPITDDLLAGLPLLVPILLDGVSIGRFLHARVDWLAMQRAALDGRTAIPVDGRLTAE
jgi:hypothetical protein